MARHIILFRFHVANTTTDKKTNRRKQTRNRQDQSRRQTRVLLAHGCI